MSVKPGFVTFCRTVRYLKPVQIYGRVWFRLYRRRPRMRPAPTRRAVVNSPVRVAWRQPSMRGPDTFVFLNETGIVADRRDWTDPGKQKLWLYNLHYFDDLVATGAEARTAWHTALVSRWMAENPPCEGPGWEPYPTALRMVNWIKWLLAGNEGPPGMVDSLATQSRWLRTRLERHLLGNHLIANAKALVFAGLFFDGPEAQSWYRVGMDIIDRELREQILSDGGHIERSPMYHQIVLEDVLDLAGIHRVFDRAAPADWTDIASRMLAWSATMCHPDGDIAFFNDAAFSIACSHKDLVRQAELVGVVSRPTQNPVVHLEHSGYVRLSDEDAVVLADLAPLGPDYLPAHGHADTLSFELSLDRRRVVVNGGTSLYGTGPERQRQRSTAAHATMSVDGEDSSEVWGGFRVARRARVFDIATGRDGSVAWATGCHDGYRRLAGRPLHRRMWRLERGRLRILDRLEGRGRHECRIVFPLAPGLVAEPEGTHAVRVVDSDTRRRIATFTFGAIGKVFVEPATWHPRFGETVASQRIGIAWAGSAPMEHETQIVWGAR